jgi:undecaprenyl pyrophosphate synthase
MQTRNLSRKESEVLAFLQVETNYARSWASDTTLVNRCRFQVVGNQSALDKLDTPALVRAASDYATAMAALQEAGQGDELLVNILAPYDFLWEIDRATWGGRFSKDQLAIPEDVDLVIRSGSIGRSPTSGAMPIQVAFSRLHLIAAYFPDCSILDLREAIDDSGKGRSASGL